MPVTKRYVPEHPAGENAIFGMSFEAVIPVGKGIAEATIDISTNTVPPVEASSDWDIGPIGVQDRVLYCRLAGGVNGVDYRIRFVATDTDGSIWPRTALCLCADTS